MNCIQKANAEVKTILTNKTFWKGVVLMIGIVIGVIGEVFIFMEVARSLWPTLSGVGFTASLLVIMLVVVAQAMYAIVVFTTCQAKDDTDDGSK